MSDRIKLLVVDDSAFARLTIARQLQEDPDVELVGVARDGLEAVEKAKALKPDVVTMDVQMPHMDGLAALERIMDECSTRVLMLSSLTDEGTEATIRALELGAVDFLCKPSRSSPGVTSTFSMELRQKVHLAASLNRSCLHSNRNGVEVSLARGAAQRFSSRVRLAVIGSSTGGPKALHVLIPALPGDLSFPVLVVQHMPPKFTRAMAERLDAESHLRVKEAADGEFLRSGQVFVAPGDYHMTVTNSGRIRLNQELPQCGVRPAVDVTMESVSRFTGGQAVGVVLTGMGSDGTRGAGCLKEAGGVVVAEAEETCVVYGMPKSVVEAGCCDLVLPLHRIAEYLSSCSG